MQRRSLLAATASLLFSSPLIGKAASGAKSARPLRIVIGYSPGGSTDIVGRFLADRLGKSLNRQVIIENRPGAGGTIGAEFVARALPDGDTLLMGGLAELAISPSIRHDLRYDPIKDFAPISLIFKVPYTLVVHPSVPAQSLKEFIEYAKSNGKNLSFASYGNYSSNHLLGELLKQTAGFESTHVPYKGSGSLITDLLAGRVQWTLDTPVAVQQYLKSGALRALAITTEQRLPILSNVPTFAEAGLPSFVSGTWIGLLAPAGTPKPLIAQIQQELSNLLNSSDFSNYFDQKGIQSAASSPEAFGNLIKEEINKWRNVAIKAGLIQK